MKLNLTPHESQICNFLMEVNNRMGLHSILRIAGGFVRDRLLGIPSDDIDIAISNMTGKQFVENIQKYAQEWEKANGKPHPALGKSYVVAANPEKSKQLETTAVEIYGLKIDFVNLREEKYDPNSRVPVMTLATGPDAAKKDAERRDLTINALFYNLNTGQVEDYVGGLGDLASMNLRTPLDPVQTFKDDPLRLLRVLRFYSKYPNAKIDNKIIDAMKMPEVHNMYADLSTAFDTKKKNYKVSPERAWPELKKMMEGKRPAEAMRILFETGLYKAVFNTPKFRELVDVKMDQGTRHHAHNLLDHTLNVMGEMNKIMTQEQVDPETRMLMNFATLFHDMGKAHPEIRKEHPKRPGEYQYLGHEDKSVDVAEEVLKTIGMGDKARHLITQVIGGHMRPHSWDAAPDAASGLPSPTDPKSVEKYYTRLHDFFSALSPIEKGPRTGKEDKSIPSRPYSRGEIAKLIMYHSMADSLATDINNPDLQDVEQKKKHLQLIQKYDPYWHTASQPFLNGRDLMQMFPTLNPAFKVNEITFLNELKDKLQKKQATGRISNKEEAVKFVEGLRRYIEEKYNPNKTTISWIKKICRFASSNS